MPKTGTPLSATAARNLKEPGKYYDLHGLFLRIEPTGSRRWVQRVSVAGRQREIGLGSADLVTLSEARELAMSNKKLARAGGDPLAAKQERIAIPSLNEAIDKVIKLNAPTWTNAKHAAQFKSTLTNYVTPKLGRRPVSDIQTADILGILTPIWSSKGETARRVKQRIGTVMKWAIAQGYRADDPTLALNQVLPKQNRKPKHRAALPHTDVSECLKSIHQSDAMLSTKLAIELLVLTATRSGEVRLAEWSEVDLETRIWKIPSNRMKMREEHIIPLSNRAIAVLKQAQTLSTDGLIFPGMKRGRPMSDATMSKLVKEIGYPVDIHGFRTSFRTWVQEHTNTAHEVAERALAHKTTNKVEAAYARSDLFEKRRKLMDAWATYLSDEPAKVVQLR
ncbi:site-specific recombinase XerD [Rhodobacteraceae bacterium HIMB11]|nr:site-specific recombinase XerD [Rhodobacteraceae bacterium HIMB11]